MGCIPGALFCALVEITNPDGKSAWVRTDQVSIYLATGPDNCWLVMDHVPGNGINAVEPCPDLLDRIAKNK